MKTILLLAVAITASASVTYLLVSGREDARTAALMEAQRLALETQKEQLERELRALRNRPESIRTVMETVFEPESSRRSPEELLAKLSSMSIASGSGRNQSIRELVHHFELLIEAGPEALPAIREYLGRYEDVDYGNDERRTIEEGVDETRRESGEERRGRDPGWRERFGRGTTTRLDFLYPPSLRIGLFDVLQRIGGSEAEKILAETLARSARGFEVAYVAKVLEEMAPGVYREAALSSAKQLLQNPVPIERPNRYDENSAAYLYSVLLMYKDPSFAGIAQQMLVKPDGGLELATLNYLTGTLGDQAVPMLYQAYQDVRLTNEMDKAIVARQVLPYAGGNPYADQLFKQIVTNDSLPSWIRAFTISSLAGGRGPLGGAEPSTPEQLQARIQLLDGMAELEDRRILRAQAETMERLQRLANPGAPSEENGRPNRRWERREPPGRD